MLFIMPAQLVGVPMPALPIELPSSIKGPWCPVMIAKLDDDGKVLRDKDGNVIEKRRLLDASTGEFYNDDPIEDVWGKVAAIPIGLPVYTAGQMIWSAGRFFIDVPAVAIKAIRQFVIDWQKGRPEGKLKEDFLDRITTEIPHRLKTNLRHFFTAPIFAIGVLGTALHGLINPFEGRKWEAKVEHMWEDNVSYKEDARLKGIWGKTLYLAFCFQPLGNLHEGRHAITWWSWRGPREKH